MDCDKYLELMSAALDGELTAEERRALDSHLAVCPECAALYQTLCGQSAALRELDCEVPADLKQRIMDNLPEQEKPVKNIKPIRWTPKTGRVIHWKRWAPVAAAACLALVVALVPKDGMGMMANKAQAPGMAAPMPSSAPASQEPRAPGATADRADGSTEAESYSHTGSSVTGDPAEAPPAADTQYGESVPSITPAPSEMPEPGEPTAPEAVEPEHYNFENPQSIRVHYGATPESGARIIGSVESLENYLAQFGSMAFDGEGNPVPIKKLEALRETYTEDFFRTRRLLCVVVVSGSGSNRYEIAAQGLSRDHVTIAAYIPEIGTCDMAAWLLTAEVDTMFEDGDVLEASIIDSTRQTTAPIGKVVRETPLSLAFDRQRSIHIRYFDRSEEGAVIIGSVESLSNFLNQFKSYIAEDLSEELQQLWNHYGYDQFFENEHLLMIRIDAPSGGDRYRIADGGLYRNSVILEQTADGVTFDVKSWLIVAEVSANFFEDGDTLKVSIDKAYDQYYPLQNIWLHRVGISGYTSSSATVIRSVEELTEYLETNIYYTDRVTGELIRDPELEDLVSMYGAPIPEWFFESRTLLAFKMGSPVYNPRYEVLTVNSEAVTVRQDHYFYGNACPSTWLVLVEVYGEFDPDNPPKLVIEDGYP